MEKPARFPEIKQATIYFLGRESSNPGYRLVATGTFPGMKDEGWEECASYVRSIVGRPAAVSRADSESVLLVTPYPPDDIWAGEADAYSALMKKLHLSNSFVVAKLHYPHNKPSTLELAMLSANTKVDALAEELRRLEGAPEVAPEVKGDWTFLTVSFKGRVGVRNAKRRLDTTSLRNKYALLYRPS